MSSINVEDLPLPALFRRAEAALAQLQASSPAAANKTSLIADALTCLDRAAVLVDSLGLFSANEDKDDLATSDMKYLRIPFLRAELLASQPFTDNPQARMGALKASQGSYEAFLARIQQYELLSSTAARCVDTVIAQDGSSAPQLDAASLRQMKIEKFKLEKSVNTRLEALNRQLRGSKTEQKGADGDDRGEDEDLESVEREVNTLQIEACALKSVENIRSLRQEIEVLAHAASLGEDKRAEQRKAGPSAPPSDLMEELRKAAGALKLGSEASKREEILRGVFRPSHVLPTMTVEQQGEIEIAQMMERQRAEQERARAAAEAKAARGREGDDSDEEDEEKIQRQRAMDDWKDDNPRGWGNSKLRPTG